MVTLRQPTRIGCVLYAPGLRRGRRMRELRVDPAFGVPLQSAGFVRTKVTYQSRFTFTHVTKT